MRYENIVYDIDKHDFILYFKQLFNTNDLYTLHSTTKEKYTELFEIGKDSSTVFHTKFYNEMRTEDGFKKFNDVYSNFIKEVVARTYNEDFLYQRLPTFRIHVPGNLCVGAFHRDLDFNHLPKSVNYILPVTHANSTASVWVESERGKEDYEAIEMRVGNLIKFYGNYLSHGSKVNKTGFSRVSFDFRCITLSDYNEYEARESLNDNETKKSITMKTKFVLGEYYSIFKK